MKTKNTFLAILIAIVMTSCATGSYFQVYKATSSDKIVLEEKFLVYEDDNCKVTYNFWGEGGNIGFKFFNKTSKNVYLNLEESFFVLNGMSFNYYKNRIFNTSINTGTTSSKNETLSKSVTGLNYSDLIQTNRVSFSNSHTVMNSSGYSVYFNEEKIICIPALTSKIINEYKINQTLYRDCDLFIYPQQDEINTKSFTKNESPFIFSNRLLYTIDKNGVPIKLENEFYISEITNYPEDAILDMKNEKFCNQKSKSLYEHFNIESADKFYIEYDHKQTDLDH